MKRTKALAAKARAESVRSERLLPPWGTIVQDVPALVAALVEAQNHLENLLPMVDPRFYDNGATILAEAKRCNAEYEGREGGA